MSRSKEYSEYGSNTYTNPPKTNPEPRLPGEEVDPLAELAAKVQRIFWENLKAPIQPPMRGDLDGTNIRRLEWFD